VSDERIYPVQTKKDPREPGRISRALHMRAYEVYRHVYGPQEAMIDLEGRGCRGGFGTGEIVAFLYASGFPKDQWRARVDEAFRGMKGL